MTNSSFQSEKAEDADSTGMASIRMSSQPRGASFDYSEEALLLTNCPPPAYAPTSSAHNLPEGRSESSFMADNPSSIMSGIKNDHACTTPCTAPTSQSVKPPPNACGRCGYLSDTDIEHSQHKRNKRRRLWTTVSIIGFLGLFVILVSWGIIDTMHHQREFREAWARARPDGEGTKELLHSIANTETYYSSVDLDCIPPSGAPAGNITFSFENPTSFSFVEMISRNARMWTNISGRIRLLPGPDKQQNPIEVVMEIKTEEHIFLNLLNASRFTQTANSMMINLHDTPDGYTPHKPKPCLAMEISIIVAPGHRLGNLNILSENLAIELADAKNHVFESRRTTIETKSGSIKGTYELLDLLSIKTDSGLIDVDVLAGEASSETPAPAEFRLQSRSGDAFVSSFSVGPFPDRDYHTDVHVDSGSFFGSFPHSTVTNIQTRSGSINAEIEVVKSHAEMSQLRTESQSGSIWLTMSSAANGGVNSISSMHRTHSGSLALAYPQEWAGTINGQTRSGSLSLRGRDVERISDERRGGMRRILAKKGVGKSTLDFSTISGSMDVEIGKLD